MAWRAAVASCLHQRRCPRFSPACEAAIGCGEPIGASDDSGRLLDWSCCDARSACHGSVAGAVHLRKCRAGASPSRTPACGGPAPRECWSAGALCRPWLERRCNAALAEQRLVKRRPRRIAAERALMMVRMARKGGAARRPALQTKCRPGRRDQRPERPSTRPL